MADMKPNEYVQRSQQFNRPHRTGKVDKPKNNMDADFTKGMNGGQNDPDSSNPHQPTPDGIKDIQDQATMSAEAPQPMELPQAPMKQAIGKDEVRKAMETLRKYKQGKQHLEDKITRNEKWWKMRHWDMMTNPDNVADPKPASGWLFNTIISKHADYMDSFPTADILPREQGDMEEADRLSSIIPVVLKQNEFKKVYDSAVNYKLKHGTGVYGVFWSPEKLNGLGDITIKSMDLLSLFWEPGVTDIQDSENFFSVELVSNKLLEQKYPQCRDELSKANDTLLKKYMYDESIDTTGKSAVVDWYYHKTVNGKRTLQYCKFVDEIVLYATENDTQQPTETKTEPMMDEYGQFVIDEYGQRMMTEVEVPVGEPMSVRGLYDHAKYPFVFDVLFPEAGMPVGFGFVDVCKNAQASIDIYNNAFEKNVQFVCSPRYMVRNDGGINEEEFANPNNLLIHVDGNLGEDSLTPVNTPTFINSNYIAILENKIQEMKETAGNRDATTGGTQSGVTAASAIAAMQESAGKTSRDQISHTYEAYKEIVYIVIELIRQFYNMPRQFRIIGDKGEQKFTQYTNQGLQPQHQGMAYGMDMGYRLPIFDIEVKAEKENAYTQMSQNELALQFYNQGFFNPQYSDQALACIDMMEFQGKSACVDKISENGTLYQQLLQMQQQMLQMAQLIDQLGIESGREFNLSDTVASRINEGLAQGTPNGGKVNLEGNGEASIVSNARERANSATAPR